MTVYLAIDLGGKRTGLAVGDDVTQQAGPVGVIQTSSQDELIRQIEKAIETHGADELVLGMPYHADGQESAGTAKSRLLARALTERTGCVVHGVDERLTSFAADQWMQQTGLTHRQKKARRDALAATAILEDFLRTL